jgi:flagellar basal-body rod protein FlgF/flagellar basal-body rod protein FlgG
MDSGFYAACTGLLSQTDALELTANNLANLNTPGYKGQLEFYRSLDASMANHHLSLLNQAVNDYGVLGGSAVDLKTGEFQKTGNDLDLAMEGSGFFVVKTPAGIRYTRNGNFHTDAAGNLLTGTGDAVMGDQGPVQLPGGTISISSDGTISQGGAVVANLQLVSFTPGTSLSAEGNSYYQAPAKSEQPADDPRLSQGMLESSNMNPVSGTISLMTLQRHAQLLEQALSIFHSVFNAAPAQDLARVS